MAQTAVLGDSHGSIDLAPPADDPMSHGDENIHGDDLASDGEVGSELGDSYVDGKRLKTYTSPQDYVEEDEGMEDGGVLGLLAQIYGTKGQGPARVI
jgi:autophagy-related protein 9